MGVQFDYLGCQMVEIEIKEKDATTLQSKQNNFPADIRAGIKEKDTK